MRIQEMKSGLSHLKKRAVGEQSLVFFETPAERGAFVEADTNDLAMQAPTCELDESCWSVVSFDKREASGLTYEQATMRMSELDSSGVAGLCIVTDSAGARMIR
jgi:hypothetical protein